MNSLKKDEILKTQTYEVESALEKFFENVLNCLTVNDFAAEK